MVFFRRFAMLWQILAAILVLTAYLAIRKPKSPPRFADIDGLIRSLRSETPETRTDARKRLASLSDGTFTVSRSGAVQLLRAAADPTILQFAKTDESDYSQSLLEAAARNAHPGMFPILVEKFGAFSDAGKWYAQSILMPLKTRESAEYFMQLVRENAPDGKLTELATGLLLHEPGFVDVLFPELLTYATKPELTHDIYNLCLSYCEANLLKPEQIAPYSAQILDQYSKLAEPLRAKQKNAGIAWMGEEDYYKLRHPAGLLLDLMKFVPDERVDGVLRSALEFRDPRLQYFAVAALLKRNQPVDPRRIVDIAASAETRVLLYSTLKGMGRADLFPKQYLNQPAFAESDMVRWLAYPAELGCVPDEIELMKVVPIDIGKPDGVYDYYLFRFRMHEPHETARDGWVAGVSGPFLRSDTPSAEGLGDTFSEFEKWDSRSPEEHIGSLRDLMERWRKHHLKESKE